ncbi:hypothetical protein [Paraburkholderia rhizosphaerae]|uniref:hypothetical protein n=1 Tax=Paraburkholderia rhizosphaerae TaxID=480658 RepID=UPI0010646C78|nr:hypothetical protein [Paraburkholderia rhizosphaerae]
MRDDTALFDGFSKTGGVIRTAGEAYTAASIDGCPSVTDVVGRGANVEVVFVFDGAFVTLALYN